MKRMTQAEAVMLCRFAKACCPQQAFDEYTPDAWFELLGDLRFEDCKEAVIDVVKGQPFVAPSEIRSRIFKVRMRRIERFGYIAPPPELGDDPAAEQKWADAIRRRVADGELTREDFDREQAALGRTGNHEMPSLEGVFRRVEGEVA